MRAEDDTVGLRRNWRNDVREIFMQELAQVGEDLQRMSKLVIDAIENASTALQTADLQLAEKVIRADEQIDEIEHSLDEQCISLLARQAPVATDLRVVIAALRMSATIRSEEHTSELQSRENLVCRLLLEKK